MSFCFVLNDSSSFLMFPFLQLIRITSIPVTRILASFKFPSQSSKETKPLRAHNLSATAVTPFKPSRGKGDDRLSRSKKIPPLPASGLRASHVQHASTLVSGVTQARPPGPWRALCFICPRKGKRPSTRWKTERKIIQSIAFCSS